MNDLYMTVQLVAGARRSHLHVDRLWEQHVIMQSTVELVSFTSSRHTQRLTNDASRRCLATAGTSLNADLKMADDTRGNREPAAPVGHVAWSLDLALLYKSLPCMTLHCRRLFHYPRSSELNPFTSYTIPPTANGHNMRDGKGIF